MPELQIPFDPLNPGQFFAACGLLDLFHARHGELTSWFQVDEQTPRRAIMVLDSPGVLDLGGALDTLKNAQYECVPEAEKSVHPIRVQAGGLELILDWWLDEFREKTTRLKCWAGQVTTGKLFADLPALIDPAPDPETLFSRPAMTKSKLGVDPRSAWNALDFGFSPDVHNRDSATYPIVEVLAAIGLQGFRPRPDRNTALYCLWTRPLPTTVARLAAISPWDGLPRMEYRFSIAKRGQSYKYFTFATCEERKNYYL